MCKVVVRGEVEVTNTQNKLVTHIYQEYYVLQVKIFPFLLFIKAYVSLNYFWHFHIIKYFVMSL